ncbi:ATP-binding cassette domain-containing protein [Oscillatoria sp. FACHB-1406]|uniref:energy-coupling factor ABC transporter ATP-binding protein n=1 Tax=Oscillatoria sp. FACHB-1406 TaxID=2692846 RepID=UPI00168A0488|nr:ATP-binding cassette domain-containing protein [Oscillatoria sp. FACHB-1406]MBD2580548.1 ATP-binding cassette domain-containing protein [Oscillatoria sp. FACHB-1406]
MNPEPNPSVAIAAIPILRLERVSLAAPIGAALILRELSFAIAPHERIALIGASGAGKTSLLRLLNRLSEPTQGAIFLEGQPLARLNPIQLRREVVLVAQEPKLLGMTVAEALAYPLKLQQLPAGEIRERVRRWCDRLHLPAQWGERRDLQLSAGQRQLCAIARGLIMQPKVLFLDEPTSALDFGTAQHLLQVLGEASDNREMTVVMANHHLEQSQQWCSRVLYLEDGQLRKDAPCDRLDWEELRDTLRQLEARNRSEWDDEDESE